MASGLSTLGTALRQVERLFELDSGTVAGLDDASLWERFVDRRDEAAFEALVIRHGPMVLSSARAIVGDHHAAEDVFQTTFVALVRRSGSIRRAETLGGWLHRVACREAVRVRTRARRRLERERRAIPRTAEAASPDRDEVRAAVHAELDRLPDAYRLPIVLCDLEGWTKAMAADHLGWTEGEVRGRLERGRARLKVRLARQGFGWAVGSVASVLIWGVEASASSLVRGVSSSKLAPSLVASTVRAAIQTTTVGPMAWVEKIGSGYLASVDEVYAPTTADLSRWADKVRRSAIVSSS